MVVALALACCVTLGTALGFSVSESSLVQGRQQFRVGALESCCSGSYLSSTPLGK